MNKIFIWCLCIFFFHTSGLLAQSKLFTDSTYSAIQKIKNDSVRNEKTIAYATELIIKKSPLAPELDKLVIKTATDKKDLHNLGKIYLSFGFSNLQLGEYAQAYPLYLQALTVYKKIDEPEHLVRAYQDLTWIQIQLTQYDNAESSIQSALKICRQKNLVAKEAEVYNVYGVFFDSQLKYDKAIECYKQALVLTEKKGTVYNKISSYMNLGISQRRSKKYNDALVSLLKANDLVEKEKVGYYKQASLQNLAELTYEMGDYPKAEKYILQALNNAKGSIESVLERGLYSNLQNIYAKKGDYKNALRYADSVAAIDKKVFAKEKVADIRNLEIKYETSLKDEKISKQNAMNLQQQQLLEINRKELELTVAQKKVQQLNFTQHQALLENQKKLQANIIQKSQLQSKLDNETLKTNNRYQKFLLLMILAAAIVSLLILYNQYKTRQLNRVILVQKKDLEDINAVKDRMFSIVGHDMRSPVNTLIAFNHLLEDNDLSADKIKVYAKEIKNTLNQTSVLMENLLHWSSSQMQGYKPEIESHQLNGIADRVINAVAAQALQKGISLKNNINTEAIVCADANMTELVMRNIVTNAIKFTPKNGLIELNTSQTKTETILYVTDNGKGMDIEQVKQINNHSTNYSAITKPGTNQEKGTGLGLLLCKKLIALMNGKMLVSSQPGQGSMFAVSLPRFA